MTNLDGFDEEYNPSSWMDLDDFDEVKNASDTAKQLFLGCKLIEANLGADKLNIVTLMKLKGKFQYFSASIKSQISAHMDLPRPNGEKYVHNEEKFKKDYVEKLNAESKKESDDIDAQMEYEEMNPNEFDFDNDDFDSDDDYEEFINKL